VDIFFKFSWHGCLNELAFGINGERTWHFCCLWRNLICVLFLVNVSLTFYVFRADQDYIACLIVFIWYVSCTLGSRKASWWTLQLTIICKHSLARSSSCSVLEVLIMGNAVEVHLAVCWRCWSCAMRWNGGHQPWQIGSRSGRAASFSWKLWSFTIKQVTSS
jgi:hypothetical protein